MEQSDPVMNLPGIGFRLVPGQEVLHSCMSQAHFPRNLTPGQAWCSSVPPILYCGYFFCGLAITGSGHRQTIGKGLPACLPGAFQAISFVKAFER